MSIVVRDARPGDGRRFEEIRVAGWHAAYVGLLDPDFLTSYGVEDERIARREAWIADPPAGEHMLLGELDGRAVGMAMLVPSRDDDVPEASELAALYVEPASRWSGIGSALLSTGFARMPHAVQLLWVLAGNTPARQFYERHGFAADGCHKLMEMPGSPAEVRYRRPCPT